MTPQARVRYDCDEYSQEELSEDSVNVNCVLSWCLTASQTLQVKFHNSFYFDSETCPQKHKHLVPVAIQTLRFDRDTHSSASA